MKHSAFFKVFGNVGVRSPPVFAFDLTGKALLKKARFARVSNYAPDNEDAPILAPSHYLAPNATVNLRANWVKSPSDARLFNPETTANAAYLQTYATDAAISFTSTGVVTANNEAFAISFLVRSESGLDAAVDRFGFFAFDWGSAGAGYLFQVFNNKGEIGRKTTQWTRARQDDWRLLRNLETPTLAEQKELADLEARIFADFQTLSLQDSAGVDQWEDRLVTLTFLPEPRGNLHIILEGGQSTTHTNTEIVATGAAGVLWGASDFVVSGLKRDFAWQLFDVKTHTRGTVEYGPLLAPRYADAFDGITYRVSADLQGGTVDFAIVTPDLLYPTPDDGSLEAQLSVLGVGWFGLRATLNSTGTNGPWLYGLAARTPGGAFAREEPVIPVLDTTNLYLPADTTQPLEEGNPILDLNTVTERNGERHGSIILRDVNGLTFADVGTTNNPGIAGILNRRASCSTLGRDKNGAAIITEAALFTESLLTAARYTDVARYAFYPPGGGAAQQGSTATAKGETRAEIDWHDGWFLLKETKCKPPLINDNLRLGAAIHAILGVCGFTLTEGMSAGPIIDGAALGESWASTNDANARCADVITGLLDRYGLGLNFYQDKLGHWRLKPLQTTSVADFVTSGAANAPDTLNGRYIIKADFDWFFDYTDYFNSFRVVWGKDGEFVSTSQIGASIYQPNFINYLGRVKEYDDVVATDIRTAAAADYALRSLEFRYGRFTKFAQSSTYYHRDLMPGDPITVDGMPCELQSIGGTSIANDAMQLVWGKKV